jgi:hypothetical protein
MGLNCEGLFIIWRTIDEKRWGRWVYVGFKNGMRFVSNVGML